MSAMDFRSIKGIFAGMVILLSVGTPAAFSKVLQGSVQEQEEWLRLNRPDNSQSGGVRDSAPLRLGRPMAAPDFRGNNLKGLVDTGSFSPLMGRANRDDAKLGLLKPADFGTIPNSKFDLGADRGSKELTLAWEAWHHQLSAAVYKRWSDMATVPGEATLRITVTKDRQIMPTLVRSSGNPEFDEGLLAAVHSLNGNPGLTFPATSQRQRVSLEADYVAATDIQPGYSWVKNDYEHIHQSY